VLDQVGDGDDRRGLDVGVSQAFRKTCRAWLG
jgi:hypothetical protein